MGFLGSLERLQLRSVCDPAKIFLTSKFSYLLFFPTQSHRTKTGTANRWEISNYTKPPIRSHGSVVRSYLLHSSLTGVTLCCAFYQPHETVRKFWGRNHFAELNWHVLTFFIQLQGCILSTGRVALPREYCSNLFFFLFFFSGSFFFFFFCFSSY